jgi:hypothetical protein
MFAEKSKGSAPRIDAASCTLPPCWHAPALAKLFRIRFIMDLPGLLMGRHFKLVGRKTSH